MTIGEEEETEKVMAEKSSDEDVNDINRSQFPQDKDALTVSKDDEVRGKMEAMQKRIDELKEKVRYEGELLYSNEPFFGQDIIIGSKSSDSLSNIKSKDTLSQDLSIFEDKVLENEEVSDDKSLYLSASSYSMCSVNSYFTDSSYGSFTKFVNNFMKNQDQKERLNLLQLHSKKQITVNMMKTSLSELETRCSEELRLIERSLKHLNKLAEEINVDSEETKDEINHHKMTSMDFKNRGDRRIWSPMTKASLKWLPMADNGSKMKLELGNDTAFASYKLQNLSTIEP